MYKTDAQQYREVIESAGFESKGRIRTSNEGRGVRLTFEHGRQIFDAKFTVQRDMANQLLSVFGLRLTAFHYQDGKAVIHLSSKPEVPFNVEIKQTIEVMARNAEQARQYAVDQANYSGIGLSCNATFTVTKK